jgi:hypothetical protein
MITKYRVITISKRLICATVANHSMGDKVVVCGGVHNALALALWSPAHSFIKLAITSIVILTCVLCIAAP